MSWPCLAGSSPQARDKGNVCSHSWTLCMKTFRKMLLERHLPGCCFCRPPSEEAHFPLSRVQLDHAHRLRLCKLPVLVGTGGTAGQRRRSRAVPASPWAPCLAHCKPQDAVAVPQQLQSLHLPVSRPFLYPSPNPCPGPQGL